MSDIREYRTITIKKYQVAIGLHWEFFKPDGKLLSGGLEAKAAESMKKAKNTYGAFKIYDDKKTGALALAKENLKGSLVGGFLIAHIVKNGIFFAKIDEDDNLFWVCAVEDGKITNDSEKVVNEAELGQKIADIRELGENIELYAPVSNHSVFPDEDIKRLELNKLVTKETIEFKIKNNKKQTNIFALAAGIMALSASGWIGYNYVYKESPVLLEITSDFYLTEIKKIEKEVKRSKPKSESSKTLSPEAYMAEANAQINDKFDRQFYTKEEIVDNLKTMVNILPEYLAEWSLTQTSYKNNDFIFVYSRISGSSGSFNEIQDRIATIFKDKPFEADFLGNNPELSIVSYAIRFPTEKREEYALKKEKMKSELLKEDPVAIYEDNITEIEDKIKDLKKEAKSLGFFDKRYGSSLENIKQNIISEVYNLNNEYDSILEIYELQEELSTPSQNSLIKNEEKLYGNHYYTYLNTRQLYPDFNIKIPTKIATLPVIKVEETKRSNQRSKPVEFEPIVDVFEIQISSTMTSLGLDQAAEAMEIVSPIDKGSIIFLNLDYNIKTNQWHIRGEMYESTN